MKISEFRKLISEEVRRVVNETYSIPSNVTGKAFIKTIRQIIVNMEEDIKKQAAEGLKITPISDPDSQTGPTLRIDMKAFRAFEKKIGVYHDLKSITNDLLTETDPKQILDYEGFIRGILNHNKQK